MAYYNFRATGGGGGGQMYDIGTKATKQAKARYVVFAKSPAQEFPEEVTFSVSGIPELDPDTLTADDFIVTYEIRDVPNYSHGTVSNYQVQAYKPTFEKKYSNGTLTVTVKKGTWIDGAWNSTDGWVYQNHNFVLDIRVFCGKVK